MQPLNAIYILDAEAFDLSYAPADRAKVEAMVRVLRPALTRSTLTRHPDLLRQADIVLSGWGAPRMDQAFLDAAPNLKAVFYAAGAISDWATPELFDRDVRVTTAVHANSMPVAEYTLSTILFSLKHGWRLSRETARQRRFVSRDTAPGNFRSVVGLVSLGVIGRLVRDLLKPFDLNILAYDPYLSDAEADLLGVTKVSLERLFAEADVVSLHTPLNKETEHFIGRPLLTSMKSGATLINTARGRIIDQPALVDVLARRPDLQAVLDVCDPEPPPADCPLFDLPNVMLTPHIAGSTGGECQRLGQCMVDELDRYLQGEPMRWEVTRPASSSRLSVRIHAKAGERTAALA